MKVLGVTIPLFTTEFDSAIAHYSTLIGESVQNRFEVPAKGITVARIGGLLIIVGSDAALAPLREIRGTLLVDSLDEYEAHLRDSGADILQPPTATPAGGNMIARGPDGVVFEYVELTGRP